MIRQCYRTAIVRRQTPAGHVARRSAAQARRAPLLTASQIRSSSKRSTLVSFLFLPYGTDGYKIQQGFSVWGIDANDKTEKYF